MNARWGSVLKPALPDTAPPAEFSAGRALKYVERISSKPHPFASAAHDEVLVEVVGLWRSLGFEPEVQTATIGDAKRGEAAKAANVLARLKGTGAGSPSPSRSSNGPWAYPRSPEGYGPSRRRRSWP